MPALQNGDQVFLDLRRLAVQASNGEIEVRTVLTAIRTFPKRLIDAWDPMIPLEQLLKDENEWSGKGGI